MALGAESSAIKMMFLRYGFVLARSGMVVGLSASVALSRVWSLLLYGVTALDPATYVAVAAALMLARGLSASRNSYLGTLR
jgi:ABC-type antimicrobial peptide transport system permease subunit